MALKTILVNTVLTAVYCFTTSKFGKEGGTAVLKCPFLSVIGWSNVGSTIMYATKSTTISDRYEVNKTSLTIRRLITRDAGIYRCTSLDGTRPVLYDIMLYIKSKPRLQEGQTVFNISTRIGSVLNISVDVHCFPKPIASWSESAGAKTGIWNVIEKLGTLSSYTLTTSVLCLHKSHLGLYKTKIRNTEGSVEITIYLMDKDEIELTIDTSNAVCNTSQNVEISCYHENHWDFTAVFKWHHYHYGILVRELKGDDLRNHSVLSIMFCDYQDAGQYVCSVTMFNQTKTISSQLIVYGVPVITGKNVSTNDTSIEMSVSFFSEPEFQSFVWHRDDKMIITNNSTFVTESSVSISCYGTNVLKQGYTIYLLFRRNTEGLKDIDSLTCDIHNVMGSSVASFDHTELLDGIHALNKRVLNVIQIEEYVKPHSTSQEYKFMNITRTLEDRTVSSDGIGPSEDRTVSSDGIGPSNEKASFRKYVLFIIIVSTVAIFGTVAVVALVIWKYFQTLQKGLSGQQNSSGTNGQNVSPEIEDYDEVQSSEEYDEIDSTSYQSVTWGDYSLEDENEEPFVETTSYNECELKYLNINDYENLQDSKDQVHRYDAYYSNVNQSI